MVDSIDSSSSPTDPSLFGGVSGLPASTGSTTTTTSGITAGDSLSSAAATLVVFDYNLGQPSLLAFASSVRAAIDNFTRVQTETERANFDMLEIYHQGCVDNSLGLLIKYNIAKKLADDIQSLYDDVNAAVNQMNASVDAYNNVVKPQDQVYIDAMNTAIAAYNTATSQLAAAQTAYDAANALFNTQTNTMNAAQTAYSGAQTTFNNAAGTYAAAVSAYNAGTMSLTDFNAANATYQAATAAYQTASSTYNTAVQLYNTQSATFKTAATALNTATQNLNNAAVLMNTKINAYNAYAQARNSSPPVSDILSYNNQLPDFNARVDALNARIAAANDGITPLSSLSDFATGDVALPIINIDISNITSNASNVSSALSDIVGTLSDLQAVSAQQASALGTLNAATTTFNNAKNTFNTAKSNFANGTITLAQYNAAITTFNVAKTAYQSAVANYNNAILALPDAQSAYSASASTFSARMVNFSNVISSFNSDFSAAIPADYINNSTTPLPQVNPPPTLSPATNPIDPLQSSTTASNVLSELQLNEIALTSRIADDMLAYLSFQQFSRVGEIPSAPPSYNPPRPAVQIAGTSGSSSGGGVSLTALISPASNPMATRTIDQMIASAAANKYSRVDTTNIVNQLAAFTTQFLKDAQQFAGLSNLGQIQNSGLQADVDGHRTDILLNLSVAEQVQFALNSGELKAGVAEVLKASLPNLSSADLALLADKVTDALSIQLLAGTVGQVAQSLNLPGLLSQILGSLDLDSLDGVLQSAQTTTTSDVLKNPVSVGFLQEALVKNIVQAGVKTQEGIVSQNRAEDIVHDAVLAAITDASIKSDEQLHASIRTQLIANGFSAADAAKQADLAQSFVQAEKQSGYLLDSAVKADSVNRQNLADQLATASKGNISASDARDAVNKLLDNNSGFVSQRVLRDGLANQLVNNGANPAEALTAATSGLNLALNQTPSTPPVPAATTDQLRTNVVNQVSAQLAVLGKTEANATAVQLADVLVGKNDADQTSLRSGLKDKLSTYANTQEKVETNAVDDLLRSYVKPTFNLYAYNQKLVDVGHEFLHNSLMNQGTYQPLNYRKSIDFLV